MKFVICTMAAIASCAVSAMAQTDPPATAPQTKEPGQQNLVINPTQAECQKGWSADLKWSKAQFDQFCSTLSRSK